MATPLILSLSKDYPLTREGQAGDDTLETG